MDITDEEFENIIKNLTARQQKLLRVLKESGELDGLVEMMEKIKLEELEDQEEDSTPSKTKSTEPLLGELLEDSNPSTEKPTKAASSKKSGKKSDAPLTWIEQEMVNSSGLSPELVRKILAQA